MTQKYYFFDNTVDDPREYSTEQWSEYFASFLTSGIYNGGENLQVYLNGTDKIARIKMGKAIINGRYYNNDSEYTIELIDADGTLDRIDRVVLRLDLINRHIKLFVLEGDSASTPVAPTLTRTSDIYEISLAQIRITHNTTVIPNTAVTDERFNNDVCGLVNSLIQVDTTQMQAKFDAFMSVLEEENTEMQEQFNTFIATLEGQGYVGQSRFDSHTNNTTVHVTDTEKAKWNEIGVLTQDVKEYDFEMKNKDNNDIYTEFEEYRTDNTLFRKTVLSNADTNGNYQTETQTRYDKDGTTVLDTKTFTLVYDADGTLYKRDEVIT